MNTKRVTSPSDVPKGPHFAIIIFKTKQVHHEGDERSRTNPGHGYPAYTEDISSNEYYVTTDAHVWELDIRDLMLSIPKFGGGDAQFVAFEVKGVADIKLIVDVEIK